MKDLIKVARKLESIGLSAEANKLNEIIRTAARQHDSIMTLDMLIAVLTNLRSTAPGDTPVYGPYSESVSGLAPIFHANFREEQDESDIDYNTVDWASDEIPMMHIIALS